jgi:uncharacterized membrane protein YraQ (UPF0718 family)
LERIGELRKVVTRKPGEPIYLRIHMVALALAVVASIAIPRLYELFFGPITLGARLVSGLIIAVVAGAALYRIYQSSARNEP